MHVLADDTHMTEIVDLLAEKVKTAMKTTQGPWAIVGVRSRGDVLADRLAAILEPRYTGSVDIALYRDDLSEITPQPEVRTTEINFPVDGTNILLVDDVLMTGRSIRAALQSLMDFGRPRCVKLLVLVDRGGRELPIAPDFVGLNVTPELDQVVEVHIKPTDDEDRVVIFDKQQTEANA